MKEIICETSSCEHNLKCRCMAGIISVGDGAKCLSRIKREGGALAQSFADVEAGEEFHGADRDSIVQCSAECALNTGGLCSAEKITVRDKLFSAKCKSRIAARHLRTENVSAALHGARRFAAFLTP